FSAAEVRNTSWRDLKNTPREVKAIVDLAGGDAFMGKQASKQAFIDHASSYKILHLAMHAYTRDENPLFSSLVFAEEKEESYLYISDIYTLQLQAELAVLSACNTGVGKWLKGEGVMSLARAFRYAGCPSIAMSLWQADDKATREIMTLFYQALYTGQEKDKALRIAKQSYLKQTGRAHPHYWSAFVLVGEQAAIGEGQDGFGMWVWVVLGCLLLGIAWFASS
ncbi:MAG: CHAT domain-containing protein, partial [Chlamydiota bacterium]